MGALPPSAAGAPPPGAGAAERGCAAAVGAGRAARGAASPPPPSPAPPRCRRCVSFPSRPSRGCGLRIPPAAPRLTSGQEVQWQGFVSSPSCCGAGFGAACALHQAGAAPTGPQPRSSSRRLHQIWEATTGLGASRGTETVPEQGWGGHGYCEAPFCLLSHPIAHPSDPHPTGLIPPWGLHPRCAFPSKLALGPQHHQHPALLVQGLGEPPPSGAQCGTAALPPASLPLAPVGLFWGA